MALSYVVTARLSDDFKNAYLKAIEEVNSGGTFELPDDIAASRDSHNKYLAELKSQGKLFCAGPFDDFTSALFIFENTTRQEVDEIMNKDSHIKNGFIPDWEIKEWHHRF
jgi:uncharacterized protein YciI